MFVITAKYPVAGEQRKLFLRPRYGNVDQVGIVDKVERSGVGFFINDRGEYDLFTLPALKLMHRQINEIGGKNPLGERYLRIVRRDKAAAGPAGILYGEE